MEAVWNFIKNTDFSGIPVGKIIAVIIVLTLTQIFRRAFTAVVIETIERLSSKTETTLDDELVEVLKPSLSLVIFLGGLWIVRIILSENLGSQLGQIADSTLNIIFIFIIAYVIYRSASILGQIFANSFLRTETELDELVRPFLPKLFQAVAIIAIAVKVSEIFLGRSVGALVGLLGGAGLTLGLLFKDILYDWFCTIIIYSDKLYKEGDWLAVSGISGFAEVLSVGFRSTTLHITTWGSIIKMPNSKMITGIVENWSQKPNDELKWGINLVLRIDGISSQQTARICDGIEEIIKSIDNLSKSYAVRFSRIEGNARVIEIRAFVNDDNLYYDIEKQLNLEILSLLEKEGIDSLHVLLRTDPEKYQQSMKGMNN
ncbi:MAG: mechanosensitive ion channel [Mastigocoleus sp. MO_167.B18]|nr:mechanosensitive ion channel [Mastigocoleus sp. MO_167.B18]